MADDPKRPKPDIPPEKPDIQPERKPQEIPPDSNTPAKDRPPMKMLG